MRRKAKAEKPQNHERWLITYADLITLLLVFFIVLYAGSQEDSRKFAVLAQSLRAAFNNIALDGSGGSSPVFTGSGAANAGGGQQQLEDFQSLVALLQRVAEERGLADRIDLRLEEDRIVIGLGSDLLFASGSAQIRPSAEPVLAAVAAALRGKPNEIRVEGHTDDVPISTAEFPSNWELSAARATAVARRLIEAGVPAARVEAAAYADTRPRADNRTPEGRAANRRAEIVVLYPPGGASSATPTPAHR
jgi:chemotaxis protein MotB